MEQATQILQIQAQQKCVQIKVEPLKIKNNVMIDKMRVQQILINLINNSIKFSNKGGSIYVTTELDNTSTKDPQLYLNVKIRVKDFGIGVA